jgi:FkbM family methyltransferase
VVLAFEPERTNYYALCGNTAINNLLNVVACQLAVGYNVGTINVPYINSPLNSNYGGLELDKDWSQTPHYVVPCTTIDSLALERCSFIKIDVEGMERLVLIGGEETIKKFKPTLYVEDDREDKSKDLRTYIKSLGYNITEHDAPLFNAKNFNREKHNVFGGIVSKNILCKY